MSAEVNKEIFTAIPHPYSYDSWGPNLEAVIVTQDTVSIRYHMKIARQLLKN
jgi:hypothetical protein